MLAKFKRLLSDATGLEAAAIGSSTIARAVQARLSACELEDITAYWQLLSASPDELQALTEAVVVAETWFFRDRQAFAEFTRITVKDWLPEHSVGVMRLLSLPCSSGEEPYSMAMALLDAGVPCKRFCIDAVDISAQALARAQRAVYGKNSFRGGELRFRDRHFEITEHGYRLRNAVRQAVRFQRGNILNANFLPGSEIYDIIFCRNLLIYFDRETQNRAIEVLLRLLTGNGVLFVGPSEAGLLLGHRFVSANVPRAFAFRKPRARDRATPRSTTRASEQAFARREMTPPQARLDSSTQESTLPTATRRSDAPQDRTPRPKSMMEKATALADQGCLLEAHKCCEEHLRTGGPSAEAFHLIGLIRAADGNLCEAEEHYRKALYLEPNHYQSLIHLTLLLEKRGDKAAAKVLSNRLRRLERRQDAQHG
jgi:chemotaxis protein methyltransferase WspC